MKRSSAVVVAGIAAALSLLFTACAQGTTPSAQPTDPSSPTQRAFKIGITQIVAHPSLDAAREGFKQALAEAGLEVTYDEQNAQGDQATATNIANKFNSAELDLILAIATPTAQATTQVITSTPLLFTAVTDPVAAQLVDSAEAPGGNVTGTSDMNPVAEQIALVKRVAPDAKTVGVIYSSGEVNSEVQVKAAREAATAQGLTLVEKTITTTGEVQQAASALDVDAIYVPTDNNVVAGLEAVIQVAESRKIPLIAGEGDSVAKGGLVTYGINYTKLGYQTGQMALRILTEGADPATMPVETQQELTLVVNPGAAERMGVELPADLLAEAEVVG